MRSVTFLVAVLAVTRFGTVTAQDPPPVKVGDRVRVTAPDFGIRNGGGTLRLLDADNLVMGQTNRRSFLAIPLASVAQHGSDALNLKTPRIHFGFHEGSTAPSFAARYHVGPTPNWHQTETTQPALWRPIGGGLIGGIVGVVAGGVIGGFWMAEEHPGPWAGVAGIIGGVVMGEPWGLACGVHIANGRRGHATWGVVVSTLLAVAGVVNAITTKDYRILIAVPVAQLAAVVPIERASAGNVRRDWEVCRNPF